MTYRVLVACCLAAFAPSGVLAAEPDGLQSYVAYYRMSLDHAAAASAFSGFDGRMVVEWKEVCGGYAFRQQLSSTFQYASGEEGRQDMMISSWESADGSSYRFHLADAIEGKEVEEFKGRAVLSRTGDDGGYADFSVPEGRALRLPRGAAFPTFFSNEILEGAREGKRVLTRTVFDGLGEDPLYDAVAFIGAALPPGDGGDGADSGSLLKDARSWPVAIGYFVEAEPDGVPSYEMSARLFENGVAADLRYDYGDLVIRAILEKIEPAPPERCPNATP